MNTERQWIQSLQQRWPNVDFRHDAHYDPQTRSILTTDTLVEDVHFSWKTMTPYDLGWRAVAACLSDIAATGGRPYHILVSLSTPALDNTDKLNTLYDGIADCCATYKCQVIGGDTVYSKKTSLTLTAVGYLPTDCQPGRRHRARPGDLIAISGPHGLSKAGLEACQQKLSEFTTAIEAHRRPIPKLKLGRQIASVLPQFAMMDSSDGLADAVLQLAQASNHTIVIDHSKLQVHPELVDIANTLKADPLDWILYGGEDFELVVCLPPETLGLFPTLKAIGTVEALHPGETQGTAYLYKDKARLPLRDDKLFDHSKAPEKPTPKKKTDASPKTKKKKKVTSS